MSMLVSTVAALSAVYPDAKEIQDPANRLHQIKRLIGKMPTIAAMSYRRSVGFPYVYPPEASNTFIRKRAMRPLPSGYG
jgi:citrate synthase